MEFGSPLTDLDYRDLEARYITRYWADAAQLRNLNDKEGREMFHGRSGSDYTGILIPYRIPTVDGPVTFRLRRRNPEIDARTKKPKGKYLSAPGDRNRLYIPPGITLEHLQDPTIPLAITEGEFKALALRRLAGEPGERPRFVPVALSGVNNFMGTMGTQTNEHGARVSVKGVIPDFGLINFVNRDTAIVFDQDEKGMKVEVRRARHRLSIEARTRGANVGYLEWNFEDGKGIDDLLANKGADYVLAMLLRVEYNTASGWEAKLLVTETGKPKALLDNVRLALENAPYFQGLMFDEFSERIIKPTSLPWPATGHVGEWTDADSSELSAWLQREARVEVNSMLAFEGVRLVAGRNSFHPVRDYLNSLKWDGERRVDTWLMRYAGVKSSHYASAVGRCWLLAAVARIFQPGCQADSALLQIGPEGRGKSQLCRVLGGQWFTDNLPDLSDGKEAASHLIGYWIVELSELAALHKAALNQTKAFLSRTSDIYRPHYGRATVKRPRMCVFIATSNNYEPLRDPTGNRRFWPVVIGIMDIEALIRDRDQLWAEAVELYREGALWYLNDPALIQEAAQVQAERTEQHVWHDAVVTYVWNREFVTVPDVLHGAIKKELAHQTQSDKIAVASILQSLGWKLTQKRLDGRRPKVYLNPEYLLEEEDEDPFKV